MLSLAVDGIVYDEGEGKILLVKRKFPPFEGFLALPGGFVGENEKLEEAVVREVTEEAGIRARVVSQVGIYDDIGRDPRGRVVSVCFYLEPLEKNVRKGSEVTEVGWFDLGEALRMKLAFDHGKMVRDFVEKFLGGENV